MRNYILHSITTCSACLLRLIVHLVKSRETLQWNTIITCYLLNLDVHKSTSNSYENWAICVDDINSYNYPCVSHQTHLIRFTLRVTQQCVESLLCTASMVFFSLVSILHIFYKFLFYLLVWLHSYLLSSFRLPGLLGYGVINVII